ncbi:MAG TPA: hypothetical protein VM282_07465 [Acidimicrobiales bacterium]|nr:hypothetical protein [Acidimicrobiales bacterium]
MLAALNTAVLAGINFDVTIRGLLVVTVAVACLMGSIWLLLATNTGIRVGTLLALTGFFGWMVIMATVWWIFGIGWAGSAPSWQTIDIVRGGDLTRSSVEKVRDLPNDPLPSGTAYEFIVASSSEIAKQEYASPIPADQLEGLTPTEAAARTADWELRNRTVTLSELAAVDRPLIDAAIEDGTIQLGGWRLQSTAQSGEAVATATAELINEGIFADPTEFKVLNTFDVGGKPRLSDNPSRWDRIERYVGNSLRLRHPVRFSVVQVQQVKDKEAIVGEAPPRPEADPTQPVISVVMERDLGNRRFLPAMTTIASLLLFGACAYVLHLRDKQSMANRAAIVKK